MNQPLPLKVVTKMLNEDLVGATFAAAAVPTSNLAELNATNTSANIRMARTARWWWWSSSIVPPIFFSCVLFTKLLIFFFQKCNFPHKSLGKGIQMWKKINKLKKQNRKGKKQKKG